MFSPLNMPLIHRKRELLRFLSLPFTIPLEKLAGSRTYNNVCMFHLGRSGSTVLSHCLARQAGVFWDGEIYPHLFLSKDKTRIEFKKGKEGLAVPYLNWRMRGRMSEFYGFECQPIHLKWLGIKVEHYVKALKDYGFEKFIFLERKNLLRMVVSLLMAQETGQWHVNKEKLKSSKRLLLPLRNVAIKHTTYDSLISVLDEFDLLTEQYLNTINGLGVQCLHLTYEDHVLGDPNTAAKKVCEFLGVAFDSKPVELQRTNPEGLTEILTNYAEVEQYLKDTKYENMLDA